MAEILQYKCPACGGKMEFDSTLQKLKCPYCDSVMELADFQQNDIGLEKETTADDQPKDVSAWSNAPQEDWSEQEQTALNVFICQSCGGEIVGDANTAATQCPYCGNNVVVKARFQGKLKPDCVIPFQLDQKAAQDRYRKFIKNKFLLPVQFKDENHINEIKGIYVPFWVYDTKVDAYARYRGENIRCWSDANYQYTETTVYDIFRQGNMQFCHIPVDGSSKMPDDLMESIEPFDTAKAVPFRTAYLAGYFADKYDVDDAACRPRVDQRVQVSAQEILRGTVNGYGSVTQMDFGSVQDAVRGLSDTAKYRDPFGGVNRAGSGAQVTNRSVTYAMYPVYLLSSTYKGKPYTFAMNGQTGKFVGDLPVDTTKKNRTFLLTFAIATAVFTLLSYLLR